MATPIPSPVGFEQLALDDPLTLLNWIASGKLDGPDLAFAAIATLNIPDGWTPAPPVVIALLPLLQHPAPPVREAAVFGLAAHAGPAVIKVLRQVAATDSSPGVRRTAEEALLDVE